MRLTYTDPTSLTTPISSEVLRELQLTQVLPNLFLLRFLRPFLTSFTIDCDAFLSSQWCIISFPLHMIKPRQSTFPQLY